MKKIVNGKVRDVYEVSDDQLVIVTSDRISAFDVVLPKPVKDKGKVLNSIAKFWFDYTQDIVPNHIISVDLADMPEFFRKDEFAGRTVLVKKLKMLPFEFIVRGYIFGNMWEAYKNNQPFCGLKIEGEYKLAEKLNEPLFTPSTKAHIGHDEYISYEDVVKELGDSLASKLKELSINLYHTCYSFAYEKGIIIADTKFEFGLNNDGNLVLADEIFTPDSSRFWDVDDYQVGVSPKSFDKQLVRDWLLNNKENGEMQFANIPNDILTQTADIYAECLRRIV
ncbi:MAG: phosphoribosylaminoimidazolesuccinocarboxamide synthase [Lachnospiraceae bacterium]|nr:phosphoribosylaminoimidazolesuccinocarboxamide synthase [Lachnospiraceae bacterium]